MSKANSTVAIGVVATLLLCLAGGMGADSARVHAGYSPRPLGTSESAVAGAEDSLDIFENANYGGKHETISGVSHSNKPGEPHQIANMNDEMTSLRWNLLPGVVVVIYENGDGSGEQFTIWGKGQVDTLSPFKFNDKASRWAWFYAGGVDNPSEELRAGAIARPHGTADTTSPVAEDTMELFKDRNFKNDMQKVGPATEMQPGQLQKLPNFLADHLTSLRWNLPPGVVVVFYEDNDGKGRQAAVWGKGEVSSVSEWKFNDKASRWAWYFVGSPKEKMVSEGH